MERNAIGWKELRAIDGERGVATVAEVRRTSQVLATPSPTSPSGRSSPGRTRAPRARTGDGGRACGDRRSRAGLRIHLEAALKVGADPDELVALAEHIAVYAGFPRALNLLREARNVLEGLGRPLPLPATRFDMGDHETLVTDTGGDRPPLVLVHALGLTAACGAT